MSSVPTTIITGKSLNLTLGATRYSEQTTLARIEPTYQTETVEPLGVAGGIDVDKGTKLTLKLTALQDWPETVSLCKLLTDAAVSGAPIDFELVVHNADGATATASGQVSGRMVPFGGDAGVLKGDVDLPVVAWDGIAYAPGT